MGQGQQKQKLKGNPASTRMSRGHKAIKRARSWGKDRDPETGKKLKHARNRWEQNGSAADNRALEAQGLPKPWDVARAQRVQRRAEQREARAGKRGTT